MVAPAYYVGSVDGAPIAHICFSTRPGMKEARACRLVIMPEWQGAGLGLRFLNEVCALWRGGVNRHNKPMPTLFHTSHPGLAASLRRSPQWCQVSCNLFGGNKRRSAASIERAAIRDGWASPTGGTSGFGGHMRAVQGFRYVE